MHSMGKILKSSLVGATLLAAAATPALARQPRRGDRRRARGAAHQLPWHCSRSGSLGRHLAVYFHQRHGSGKL